MELAYVVPKPSKAPKRLSPEQTARAIHNWKTLRRNFLSQSNETADAINTTMKIFAYSAMLVLGGGGNFHGTATLDRRAARDPRFWLEIADFCKVAQNTQHHRGQAEHRTRSEPAEAFVERWKQQCHQKPSDQRE